MDHNAAWHSWGLIQDGVLLRSGRTLASLATSSEQHSFEQLLDRLASLTPLSERPDHALQHLHACAKNARALMEDPRYGLSADAIGCLMNTFEAALIAATDDLIFFIDDSKLGPVRRDDHAAVASIASRHGSAIRQWWSTYSAAIEALFGGANP
ncbi:hypothetical protein [Rhizobium sp. C4]|uniref:hypothetical protein n=1 Tax=Rhizobium sp. C4 TaxID=1349800 RepID=UPI001E29C14C|nr:hypothetical protein [Rhizobium sp. C4]MCD2172303.1 hypothetical protein [Rhizobium sp. C4]